MGREITREGEKYTIREWDRDGKKIQTERGEKEMHREREERVSERELWDTVYMSSEINGDCHL